MMCLAPTSTCSLEKFHMYLFHVAILFTASKYVNVSLLLCWNVNACVVSSDRCDSCYIFNKYILFTQKHVSQKMKKMNWSAGTLIIACVRSFNAAVESAMRLVIPFFYNEIIKSIFQYLKTEKPKNYRKCGNIKYFSLYIVYSSYFRQYFLSFNHEVSGFLLTHFKRILSVGQTHVSQI